MFISRSKILFSLLKNILQLLDLFIYSTLVVWVDIKLGRFLLIKDLSRRPTFVSSPKHSGASLSILAWVIWPRILVLVSRFWAISCICPSVSTFVSIQTVIISIIWAVAVAVIHCPCPWIVAASRIETICCLVVRIPTNCGLSTNSIGASIHSSWGCATPIQSRASLVTTTISHSSTWWVESVLSWTCSSWFIWANWSRTWRLLSVSKRWRLIC